VISSGGPNLWIDVPEPATLPRRRGGRSVPVGLFPPASTFICRVHVGALDAKARSAYVELGYVNHYRYEYRDSDGHHGVRSGHVWLPHSRYPVALTPGRPTLARFTLPPYGPPSVHRIAEWKLRAVIDRRHGLDTTAELPLTVPTEHGMYDHMPMPIPAPSRSVPIYVEFDGTAHLRRGYTVTGRLVGHPVQHVKARAVRLELERVQHERRGLIQRRTMVTLPLAGSFTILPGYPFQLPFALPLSPALTPSCYAANNSWEWQLKAVVDVELAMDPVSTTPITLT
jgi:hypothetical protein